MAKKEKENILKPNGGYPMHTMDDLRAIYYPYITLPKDRQLIEEAYEYAKKMHEGQFRKSGEPYIQHPIEVAYIVASLQCGPSTIISAFLHDVVEDTPATIEDIKEKFGDDVAKIVDALTNIQRMKLSHNTQVDFDMEDHRKIFLGMAKDIRVIIVKLADRLHNMRTLSSLSPERQKVLASQTLEVFVPIAHRLGIYKLQSEMQDLCLRYSEPEKYQAIQALVDKRFEHSKGALGVFSKKIADDLLENNIPFHMESRVKSVYSIYEKMYKKDYSFDEIYDVLAIRIITKTVLNCYEILGVLHSEYTPLPGRFKDYIAVPKANMYQSLHTAIVAGDGRIYEIQIRTEEMDQVAETGVAAHWKYKEGSHYNPKEEQKEIEDQLHWFRDFVSLSDEAGGNAKEYVDSLTNDIFGASVYVFTPLGKVIDLPSGSTTLDFAYRIHSKVGDSAVGAIVNGSLVPLSTVLKTGDVCEIKTSKTSQGPNDSWLQIAKTSSAKSKIKRALQKRDEVLLRDNKIKAGKSALMDSFKMQGYDEEEALKILSEGMNKIENEFHHATLDDLCVAVSNKNPTAGAVLDLLKVKRDLSSHPKLPKKGAKVSKEGPPVSMAGGFNGLAITLANCCSPLPGDDIVGYISQGKGIVIHRRSCPNIAHEDKRLIDVSWKDDVGLSAYKVDIEIYANDRQNLIADILSCIASKNLSCQEIKGRVIPSTMNSVIHVTLLVGNAKELSDLSSDLLGVKGIYSVNRLTH